MPLLSCQPSVPCIASFGDRLQFVLTSEELGLEVHLVERIDGLIVVGLNLTCERCRKLANCFHDSVSGAGAGELSSHEGISTSVSGGGAVGKKCGGLGCQSVNLARGCHGRLEMIGMAMATR